MSKELTPLEALKLLKYMNEINGWFEFDFAPIETTLKEHKELKKIVKQQIKTISYYENLALKNKLESDKKLKALEIIKNNLSQEEKQVLLNVIYTYTKNEEEYDLLKGVLL